MKRDAGRRRIGVIVIAVVGTAAGAALFGTFGIGTEWAARDRALRAELTTAARMQVAPRPAPDQARRPTCPRGADGFVESRFDTQKLNCGLTADLTRCVKGMERNALGALDDLWLAEREPWPAPILPQRMGREVPDGGVRLACAGAR